MNKKFALVLVHGYFKDTITILHQEEFGTCMCDCEILFEADSLEEVINYKSTL